MAAGKNILFFDIDGTLLTDDFQVPASVGPAVAAARKNGNLCIINSGRPFSHIDPKVRAIDFDGYICSCGMHILLEGKELYHQTNSPEFCRECVQLNRRCGVPVIYESETAMGFDDTIPLNAYMEKSREHFRSVGLDVDKNVTDADFTFDKFSAWILPSSNDGLFKDFIFRHFDPIVRGNGLYEVVGKGCSKKTGMDLILRETGISPENTYAIGDSLNDLEMLEHTAHSIGMGNGMPEVLERVEYVTDSIDRDGVEKALEHYGLI